jgi:spore coat polysaccharide biosynthesis protein SpsF
VKVVVVVQARMGSSRLPGKVLAEVGGRSILAHVLGRLGRCRAADELVVATTDRADDDRLADAAAALGATVVRGSTDDVLARYLAAARATAADVIVRVTADCPLIDPGTVDAVVAALVARPAVDYASNTHVRTFPRGLDAEALWRDTLERLGRLAQTPATREHVTSFVLEQPALFRIRQVTAAHDDSDLRLTVDTPDDLALVQQLELALGLERVPPPAEVIAHLRANPALVAINAHVEQRPWAQAAAHG